MSTTETTEREKFTVLVRSKESPRDTTKPYVGSSPEEAFKNALGTRDTFVEPIMTWHSTEDIAAIDIDYHGENKPNREELLRKAYTMDPRPNFSWVTHGGGVRLIYIRDDSFTAIEQVMLAMLNVGHVFCGYTGVEIKRDTRHPSFPRADGSQASKVQEFHVGKAPWMMVAQMLHTPESVDDQQVEEWLDEHGNDKGQRLPHSECPIDPTADPKNDCVICLDSGIFCHRCEAQGEVYPGCSRPGFVPWCKLVGGEAEVEAYAARFNHLRTAVKNMCHWQHAQCTIRYLTGWGGKHAEHLYRMLLRYWHTGRIHLNLKHLKPGVKEAYDTLIDRCFYPKIPIVRADGYWAHPSDMTTPYSDKGIAKIVSTLPAVCYVDRENGEIKTDKLKLGIFESNGCLIDYGYPPLEPIRGVDIAELIPVGDNEQNRKSIPALVPSEPPIEYCDRAGNKFDYKEHIRRRFPGVNINLLKLLIAAKGFSQRSSSEPPRILITGQSGGGKTAHVLLAAVMTGDTVGKVPIDQDPEKFIRNFATESKRNGFVFSDEIAKSRLKPTDLCARLLHVSRETTYHQLYVGSTKVGRLAVHVMADTLVPRTMREEVQLARRIVHVDLGAGVNEKASDWRNGGDIDDWLTTHTEAEQNLAAASMLVSEVMDEIKFKWGWLAGTGTFEDYAKKLGFNLLRDAVDGADADEPFRDLFKHVIDAPDCGKGQWKGPGWKVFGLDDRTPLATAFRECLEGGAEGDHQAITGRQWGGALKVPGLVCELSSHRRQIGIRFRVGDARSKGVLYNRDVLPVGHPMRETVETTGSEASEVLPFPSRPVASVSDTPSVAKQATRESKAAGNRNSLYEQMMED